MNQPGSSAAFTPDFEIFLRLMQARHSCRAYKPDPLPRDLIDAILTAAQRTPSDCNAQPWQVTVVGGAALDRLRQAMYERAAADAPPSYDIAPIARYSGVHQERRRACGWGLYSSLGIERGDRAASREQALKNFRFFEAPHLAFVTTSASLGIRAAIDCGGYVMSFLLAAQALGVSAVPQAAIAYRTDVIRAHLPIPEDELVVCGISFGWGDHAHPANGFRTSRASISEVATFIED